MFTKVMLKLKMVSILAPAAPKTHHSLSNILHLLLAYSNQILYTETKQTLAIQSRFESNRIVI